MECRKVHDTTFFGNGLTWWLRVDTLEHLVLCTTVISIQKTLNGHLENPSNV